MWCSDWAKNFCGNVSWLEEHPLNIYCDLHARFGRCFRTAGASWARRAHFVGIWHYRRGPLLDTGRLASALLEKFCMVVAGWNEEPTQNFRPIVCHLAGETAFQKNCKVWRLQA